MDDDAFLQFICIVETAQVKIFTLWSDSAQE